MAESATRTAEESPLSLAIVGGGIAGLMLALSTAQRCPQITLTIYESAHALGEIGAGVFCGPNAVHALTKISEGAEAAFERVRTRNQGVDMEDVYFTFRSGMDGATMEARYRGVFDNKDFYQQRFNQPGRDWGCGMVHRAEFLDEMVKLIPDTVTVKFGKRLVDVEDEGEKGVLLTFADGSEARHAALVGCDGIKSRTRVHLLGNDNPASHAVFSGKYCYRGLIPMDEAMEAIGREEAGNSTMFLGYHGHMLIFPVQKGKTMNVVAFSSADTWEDEEWIVHADREKMYNDFEGWGDHVQKILRMMQKPDIWALFNHLPAETYYKGRVCLAGDAAHASTPHQGSGASMAIEDGYVMSMILKHVNQPQDFCAAFAAYDKVRRPRTQRVVTTSRECGILLDFEGEGIGDDISKIQRNLEERMEWIWNKQIDDDVQEAVEDFKKRV